MKMKQWIRGLTPAILAAAAVFGIHPSAGAARLLTLDHPDVKAAVAVQSAVTDNLMGREGVLGTAIGLDDSGKPGLVVYVDQDSPSRAATIRQLPPRLRGVGVKVEMTDKFRSFARPAGTVSRVSHTAIQKSPIQLGTSGGWRNDLANGYCCGGTLGSLIQANGTQYVLSNYHVFEADIVDGGNGMIATTGDYIIQPGLIDVGCSASRAQNVATLVKLSSLPDSNVDCSVAKVLTGMVSSSILEIGAISSTTVKASLTQAVKKSGRTTGLTTSKVSGLNATIRVAYDNECAGGAAFTKTFTGQIVVANKGSSFLNSGDSGSLMVENVSASPRAVGLLYAGSSTSAIANPIGEVLTFIGGKLGGTATMVGN